MFWCDQFPQMRYPLAAKMFKKLKKMEGPADTARIVMQRIEEAQTRTAKSRQVKQTQKKLEKNIGLSLANPNNQLDNSQNMEEVPTTSEESKDQKMYAELKPCSLEDELDEETADEGDRFSQIMPPYQQPKSQVFHTVESDSDPEMDELENILINTDFSQLLEKRKSPPQPLPIQQKKKIPQKARRIQKTKEKNRKSKSKTGHKKKNRKKVTVTKKLHSGKLLPARTSTKCRRRSLCFSPEFLAMLRLTFQFDIQKKGSRLKKTLKLAKKKSHS
ncbi:uncharacterized protein LOC121723726 isoform X3 [Alosa sapidissima]|uniref:uncharacterized protein LOC121723726 isoform X3 n=1 Tax=Alosa sapidissima TaxID=34773 RepID=UPI001C09B10F|nr:uncharacterized protein LOC121723726 isoform X3 [Alosa sapidissima]